MSTTKNEATITTSFDSSGSERDFDSSNNYGGALWSSFNIQKLSCKVKECCLQLVGQEVGRTLLSAP